MCVSSFVFRVSSFVSDVPHAHPKPETRNPKRLFTLLVSLALLGSTGCVHQSMTIRTEPPGASVYVNDERKGISPVTYDFDFYGWQRVTLRKEGFERLDERRLLKAPIYLWIPLDLFMELMPFPITDTHTWSYVLTPAAPLETPTPPVIPQSPARSKTRKIVPLPFGAAQPSAPADAGAEATPRDSSSTTTPPSTTEPTHATR